MRTWEVRTLNSHDAMIVDNSQASVTLLQHTQSTVNYTSASKLMYLLLYQ